MLDDKRAKAKIEDIIIYITNLTTSGGVRTQKVAFHNSNQYHLKGYGAKGREFSIEFLITSEGATSSIEKLSNSVLEVLKKKAPFTFTDPFLGKLQVLCSSYSFNLHITYGSFSCTFQELPSKEISVENLHIENLNKSIENYIAIANVDIQMLLEGSLPTEALQYQESLDNLTSSIEAVFPGLKTLISDYPKVIDAAKNLHENLGKNKGDIAGSFMTFINEVKTPGQNLFYAHKKIYNTIKNLTPLKVITVFSAIKQFAEGELLRREVPILSKLLAAVEVEVMETDGAKLTEAFNDVKYRFFLFLKEKKPILDGQQDIKGDGSPLIVRYYEAMKTTKNYEDLENYNTVDNHLFFSNEVIVREV